MQKMVNIWNGHRYGNSRVNISYLMFTLGETQPETQYRMQVKEGGTQRLQ